MIDQPKIGDLVSYEDAANPLRVGFIVAAVSTPVRILGTGWHVEWRDELAAEGEFSSEVVSDLRQHGWKLVAPQVDPFEDLTDESGAVLRKWLGRGDGVAVYENQDLGHPELGHRKYVSFGSWQAQLEGGVPPTRLPDIGADINWRYGLVGVHTPPSAGSQPVDEDPGPDLNALGVGEHDRRL